MRMLAAAAALVGCGRVAFDATTDAPTGDVSGDSFVAPCLGPDEDEDGWPDGCDNCPTVPNVDQADDGETSSGGSSDGIGDACDPRPFTAGDTVLFFDNFDAQDARYMLMQNATYVGGRLRLGDLNASGFGQAFFDTPLTVTRVELAYEIVDYAPTGTQWIGIWTDVAMDSKLFSESAWDAGSPSQFTRIKEMTPSGDNYSPDIETPGPWVVGAPYRSVTEIGSTYRMTFTTPGMAPRTTELALTQPRADVAFLETEKLVADFLYLIVYVTP